MEILITIKADKDDLTALSTEKESANIIVLINNKSIIFKKNLPNK